MPKSWQRAAKSKAVGFSAFLQVFLPVVAPLECVCRSQFQGGVEVVVVRQTDDPVQGIALLMPQLSVKCQNKRADYRFQKAFCVSNHTFSS